MVRNSGNAALLDLEKFRLFNPDMNHMIKFNDSLN